MVPLFFSVKAVCLSRRFEDRCLLSVKGSEPGRKSAPRSVGEVRPPEAPRRAPGGSPQEGFRRAPRGLPEAVFFSKICE